MMGMISRGGKLGIFPTQCSTILNGIEALDHFLVIVRLFHKNAKVAFVRLGNDYLFISLIFFVNDDMVLQRRQGHCGRYWLRGPQYYSGKSA